MAFAGRMRSSLPLVSKLLRSEFLSLASRSAPQRALLSPTFSDSEFSRNYATATGKKEDKNVKVPLALYGGAGNYSSALYLAAVKANVLDKVESELVDLVDASKKSPLFSAFIKDLSVKKSVRVQAINEICAHAKLSDVTKNFLALLAENDRLRNIEAITKKFLELTRAHRGEVIATVTTVIIIPESKKCVAECLQPVQRVPLPPQEEKDLKDTLQEILGQGTKVKLEQKIDPSILGGLVVEFSQKVFDMSIKTRASQMERFLREPVDISSL